MSAVARNNVRVAGNSRGQPMLFAHGFGCDQHMWRYVTPAFEADHRIVLFDHVGAGDSDHSAHSRERHSSRSTATTWDGHGRWPRCSWGRRNGPSWATS